MRTSALAIIPVLAVSAALALTGCSGSSTTTSASDAGATSASPQASVRRLASASTALPVTLVNHLPVSVKIAVDGTDNYDWDSRRPDHASPEGFQGLVLAPASKVSRTFDVNAWAHTQPFVLNLTDSTAGSVVGSASMTTTIYLAEPAGFSLRGHATLDALKICPAIGPDQTYVGQGGAVSVFHVDVKCHFDSNKSTVITFEPTAVATTEEAK